MPHKHKRDKSSNASSYDLPPTTLARSLPVIHPSPATTTNATSRKPRRHANKISDNDTPRAFTRLLNHTLKGHKTPSGLDDNIRPPSKKRKRTTDTSASQPLVTNPALSNSHSTLLDAPKILPSERLSAFAARVDAALPVVGLVRSKRGGAVEGDGSQQTKMERKMQRMQREWREEDRRRRERAEEEEDAEYVNEDNMGGMSGTRDTLREAGDKSKSNRKKKTTKKPKKHKLDKSDLDEDDPWATLVRKRAEQTKPSTSAPGTRGLVGLHDVVLAPPKLTKLPREKIKPVAHRPGTERAHGAKPTPVLGLRKQAELSAARQSVVEGYRQMMRDRRREEDEDGGGGGGGP